MSNISVDDLARKISGGEPIFILDVRTPAEFSSGHIPGAINIPLDQVDPSKISSLAGSREVVTVCQAGGRSSRCYQALRNAGIGGLSNLAGGTNGWIAAGNPVAGSGKAVISIERQVRIVAGAIVLLGLLLGTLVSPLWLLLSGFVGAGLVFAGITDWCGMALLLGKMPWNQS